MSNDAFTLQITIDAQSAVPPFEQLRVQIVEAVRDGSLAVGTRLPPVRKLAEQLGLAANTVARSYRELEQAHVIETRGRAGSFVAAQGDENERMLHAAAVEYAERAERLGLDRDTALRLVSAAFGMRQQG